MGISIANGLSTPTSKVIDWVPTNIANCKIWLRADLGITLNGSTVSQWNDQSGNSNNASQGTAAKQPTYTASDSSYGNQPTLTFASASSQEMALVSLQPNQPYTAYAVCESTSGATNQAVIGDGNPTTLYYISGTPLVFAGSNLSSGINTRVKAALCGVFNTTTSAIYVNSSTAAASGNAGSINPSGTLSIGAFGTNSDFLNGKIAEIIVYSGAHNSTQVSTVFSYFSARYAGSWH